MSIVRFSAKILVIIALLSPSLAAGGFENFSVGIQARGLSGAFRAIADDWTAAYYNPAGYALIQDNQMGGTVGLIHLRNELTPDYRLGDVYEVGIFNDVTNYNKHEIYNNPSGGFLVRLPVMGETVMGLSAYQPFDYNITWKLYDLPLAYNDVLSVPGDQFSNNIDVVAFQLTFAREIMEEKAYFGLGLQLLRADLIYTNVLFRDNPYDGTPLDVRPWDKITEWNKNDGKGWGFGLRGGLMVDLTDKLNLGFTAALPFDITLKGSSMLAYYMPLNADLLTPGGADGVDYLPGTPEYLFASGSLITDSADFEAKLKLPASFGMGLAYSLTENLTLSLDGEYTLWSKFDGLDFVFSNHHGLTGAADTSTMLQEFFTEDISNPVEWKDAAKVAMGVRYDFRDRLTFLAGGSMDQSPAEEALEFKPQLMDTGTKYSYSTGVIYHHGQWDFGLAGSITTYPDLAVDGLVDTDGDDLPDNFTGEYKANTYETVLSFNYRF
ncbi:MAG: outer membrane protein transport protein [Candidatus Zixiibacteriota bacterium]|nr:MAG: outer membrane protein transport protein [candidate division Zixibacteria bacterium]